MDEKVRTLVQREWDQLLIVATGFLPLTNGDLKLEEGGLALAYSSHKRMPGAAYDDLGPPDVSIDASEYARTPGPAGDGER